MQTDIIAVKFQDFLTIFIGILVEAFPFILLGTLISYTIRVFLSEESLIKLLPKKKMLRNFTISLSGIFLPVCECGNVPVARQLLMKKMHISTVLTFLFAAPIVNPITFITTWQAFDIEFALYRVVFGLFLANVIGYIFLNKNTSEHLTDNFNHDVACSHGHKHKFSAKDFSSYMNNEFNNVYTMLILGSGIASFTQIFIPRNIIYFISRNIPLSIIVMMLLGVIVSICSSVDAFFAISFPSFSPFALMAFLVFGPVIDIKMLAMLKTTFKTKTLAVLTVITSVLVFLVSYLLAILL